MFARTLMTMVMRDYLMAMACSRASIIYDQSCESIATHVSESLGHTYTRGGWVLGYDEDRHSSSGCGR